MDMGCVLCEAGTVIVCINYKNVKLQRVNVIKSQWPNMLCHFLIPVGESSWFVHLRLAWAGCQLMKPTYDRRCTKNKHFSASPPTHVLLATHFRRDVTITSILMHFRLPSSHWICGGQSGTARVFSPSTSVSLCQYQSTNAPHSFIYQPLMLCNVINWEHC
jgi:hypothetical protein